MPPISIPGASNPRGSSIRLRKIAAPLAWGAAIVVFRVAYVSHYAAALPFWDQWDAELDRLFGPLAQHRFDWASLIASHNEHRILFTRLLSIALWQANARVFDNRVECYANIVLVVAMYATFVLLLRRRTNGGLAKQAAPALLALVLCLPIDWENFLVGFQNGFYFASLATLLVFGLLTRDRFTWRDWLPACVLAFASLFTMASGLFTAVIACALAIWRSLRSPVHRLPWPALPFAAVVAFGVAMQTRCASCAAHSDWMKHAAVLRLVLGWPALRPDGLLFLIPWLPLAATLPMLRTRLRERPGAAFPLALAAWSLLVACSIAVARDALATRYAAALVLGLLANAILACELVQAKAAAWKTAIAVVFAAYAVVALATRTGRDTRAMIDRFAFSRVEMLRVLLFERTHDAAALRAPDRLQIPYHDPRQLAAWLADSAVLTLLPPPFNPHNAAAPLSRAAEWLQHAAGRSWQWQATPLRLVRSAAAIDPSLYCRVGFIDDHAVRKDIDLAAGDPLILTGTGGAWQSGHAQVRLRGARSYALDAVTGFDEHGYVAISDNAPPPGHYSVLLVTEGTRACDTGTRLAVRAQSMKKP